MSLIAARASLRQVAIRRTGLRHSSGHGHGDYSFVPFKYSNKTTFAVKVTAYLVAGFSIPFLAAGYQLKKAAGGA
ncbi:hypothetical protein EIP91_011047 [Steccherinum ochraceum]|uniref:Cytochrome c oxidase subunit 8, mitochondrial n=1 Tax=Steccherinum ochraceum TaxID=92696 RepID=A0A4R0RTL2_9APHY|nr:hypothetical protein EIP91_011047 [Steccherinum ochraceum]